MQRPLTTPSARRSDAVRDRTPTGGQQDLMFPPKISKKQERYKGKDLAGRLTMYGRTRTHENLRHFRSFYKLGAILPV